MAQASPSASSVEMNELMLPQHANALGTAFGGVIMSWIDICAAMAAQRHARCIVVTASMDSIDFLAPISVGDVVNLQAMVNYVGRTSIHELFLLDEEMHRVIMEGADATTLHGAARRQGMITLYEDGLRKVVEGQTSLEEVMRVTQDQSQDENLAEGVGYNDVRPGNAIA